MKKKNKKKELPAELYAYQPNPNLDWKMYDLESDTDNDLPEEAQKAIHHAADQFFKVVFGGGGEGNVETCILKVRDI